ncbi:MAG: ATP-binding protein, partial [bacterium]
KKIFERFYQVTHKNVKKYDGTGLGLTISKSIVEKLNGKLVVESELGVGSIFKFTIPIIENNKNTKIDKIDENSNIHDWSNKNILIIEDNQSNYLL